MANGLRCRLVDPQPHIDYTTDLAGAHLLFENLSKLKNRSKKVRNQSYADHGLFPTLLYFHRTQMPWQRANHDALLLIVMQEVDPEQILRIISHSQVIIQGTLNRLPISAWKVFDLVLAWRILNRCDTSWFYLEGTTILL